MSMMPYFVPTRFVWRFGGKQVSLCGSFTRWVETVQMIPVDQSPGVFAVLVHLPAGYHQYKFIVDGEWRHDETQPFMPDPLGNVNNWLFVRQPDAAGAVPIGIHMPSSGRPTDDTAEQHHAMPGSGHSHYSAHGHAQQQQHGRDPRHAEPHGAARPAHAPRPPVDPPAHRRAVSSGAAVGHMGSEFMDSGVPGFANPAAAAGPASAHGGSGIANGMAPGSSIDAGALASGALSGEAAGAVVPPIAIQDEEPAWTRRKVLDFLSAHTAYELIPESGKVVVIDLDYSVRQAFHALHRQAISSAPLWDGEQQAVVGMISASDFIEMLRKLRAAAGDGGGALSDSEMDAHTIRAMRAAAAADGVEPRPLVFCRETDTFSSVVRTLVANRCSISPILASPSADNAAAGIPDVLHNATLSGVLACLMRHFRASLASLPLLQQPLASMPIGSWSPESPIGQQGQLQSADGQPVPIRITPIHTIQPTMPLTTALSMLVEASISALPVVDADGALLDVYARGDITLLARGNAYSRLQCEDMTVGHALALAGAPSSASGSGGAGSGSGEASQGQQASKRTRLYVCTRQDQLRLVLERLSMPAVRRVIVVHPDTYKVEGIISLSDVARFMFMADPDAS